MFSGSHELIIQHATFSLVKMCFSFSLVRLLYGSPDTLMVCVHGCHLPPTGKLPFLSAPSDCGSWIAVDLAQKINCLFLHDHLIHGPPHQHRPFCRKREVFKRVMFHKCLYLQTSGTHHTPPVLQDHCPSLQPYWCPHKHTCQHRSSWHERSSVCPHASEKQQ